MRIQTLKPTDAELEQGIIRPILGSIVVLYVFLRGLACYEVNIGYIVFLLCSIAIATHIHFKPGDYCWRKLVGQCVDMVAISSILYLCGEVGLIAYGIYLWVILGNGFRFGLPYLASAVCIGLFFFTIIATQAPFFKQHPYMTLGLGITQLIVPVYFAILLRRLKLTTQRLKQLSLSDELTGLLNRRAFDMQVSAEVSRLNRFPAPFVLVLVDIDHFKRVNDTYGHLTGDAVLKMVAKKMQNICREVDVVARFGGEEFVLLLPGLQKNEVKNFGERLRENIEKADFSCDSQSINITISVGLSPWRQQYQTAAEWIKAADDALYTAKKQGRNRVVDANNLDSYSESAM